MPCSVSLCTWIPLPSRRSVLFQDMRNRATLLWTGCIREGEALFCIFIYLDTPTLTQVCSISGYEKQGDTALDRLHKRRDALFCIFMYLDTPTLTQVCSISGYEKQGDTALDRLHKRRGSPVLYLYVPGYPYPHAGLFYFRV